MGTETNVLPPAVESNTVESSPTVEPNPRPVAAYAGDPFIVATDDRCPVWIIPGSARGHFMDTGELSKSLYAQRHSKEERFVIPNDFDEFYAWKPDYVVQWVKRRLNIYVMNDEVEDWTQDLLIHLRYLPHGSKHRLPGANGRPGGCEDVIETYDPLRQFGASECRFRNYINNILGNKFLTVQSKRQKNPVLRPGNVSFGASDDENGERALTGDEFVHANSAYLASHNASIAKQAADRLYTNQFKEFVMKHDPQAFPALEALESTGTLGDAAKFAGVADGEFARLRNRLKQLAECFEKGSEVPRQRKPYKKRAKDNEASSSRP